jgi:hypothetical protein
MKSIILTFSLIVLACASTGMQKKENEAPLKTVIRADKTKVYQLTASKLMEYGFTIETSDPVLGSITTNFMDLNAGVATSAFLGALAGMKDFKAKISTQIVDADSGRCELIMRGLGQYAEDKGLFQQDEIKSQPVRKDSYTYKRMQEISSAIKEAAEK